MNVSISALLLSLLLFALLEDVVDGRKFKLSKKIKPKTPRRAPRTPPRYKREPQAAATTVASSVSSDAFCQQFVQGCYQVAMQGKQSGQVKIVQQCQRTGDATSASYTFGCQADGVELTQVVLDSTGTTLTMTMSSTVVTTQTAAPILTTSITKQFVNQTLTQRQTTKSTSTATVSSVVTTAVATQILFGTDAITVLPPQQTLATSAVPIKKRLFGGIGQKTTAKTTAKTTSTSTKTTSTAVATPTNTSPFCRSFAASCTSVCGKVNSTPQTNSCSNQASLLTYAVACLCKNGQSGTSAALQDVAGKFQLPVQTIKTVASTTVQTPTSTVIQTTLASTTVATVTSVATALVTVTSVVPVSATSTTQIVLAPTGRVAVKSQDGAVDAGFLVAGNPSTLFTASLVYPDNVPTTFMAVQDASSGLYQLQLMDGSDDVLAFESGFGVDPTSFASGSSAYAFAERVSASACAAASEEAAAADGQGVIAGNPCATFVFSSSYNASGPTGTLNLDANWINNAGDAATAQSWIFDNTGYALLLASDPDTFANNYGETVYPAELLFPA